MTYYLSHFFGKVGNEAITKELLKSILKRDIQKVDLSLNREVDIENIRQKRGIIDIRARIDGYIECIIEMQVVDQKNIEKRMLYYWSNMYSKQLIRGKEYSKLKKVIAIVIADFKLERFQDYVKYHTTWKITEEDDISKILTDDLEIHIIEIPKITKIKNNKKDKLIDWIKFIKNPESEEVKEIMKTNQAIKMASEKLGGYTQEEIEIYDAIEADMAERDRIYALNRMKEERKLEIEKLKKELLKQWKKQALKEGQKKGIQEGKKQGIQEGKKQGIQEGKKQGEIESKIKIAKNMLGLGMDVTIIEKVTNLSKKEIDKIVKV